MPTYTQELPLFAEADVVVLGSGSAGSTAAIASARTGADTLLVERYGFLGGTSTTVLDTFYGFSTPGRDAARVVNGSTRWEYVPHGDTYDIPYRDLLPQGINNLVVAGRCLSADHDAHASVRSMGQCMAMGQAAGTAAALSAQSQIIPANLNITDLQTRLRADGALFSGATVMKTTA